MIIALDDIAVRGRLETQPIGAAGLEQSRAIEELFTGLSPETQRLLEPLLGFDYLNESFIEASFAGEHDGRELLPYVNDDDARLVNAFFSDQVASPGPGEGNHCCDVTGENCSIHVHGQYLNGEGGFGHKLYLAMASYLEIVGVLKGRAATKVLTALLVNQPRYRKIALNRPEELAVEVFRAIDEIVVDGLGDDAKITARFFGLEEEITTEGATEKLEEVERKGMLAQAVLQAAMVESQDDRIEDNLIVMGGRLGMSQLGETEKSSFAAEVSRKQTELFIDALRRRRGEVDPDPVRLVRSLALLHGVRVDEGLRQRVGAAANDRVGPGNLSHDELAVLVAMEVELLSRDSELLTDEEMDLLSYVEEVRDELGVYFINYDNRAFLHREDVYHFEANGEICTHHAESVDSTLQDQLRSIEDRAVEIEQSRQEIEDHNDAEDQLLLNPHETWWALEMQRQLRESQTGSGMDLEGLDNVSSGVVGVGVVGGDDRGVVVERRESDSENNTLRLEWGTDGWGIGFGLFGFNSGQTESSWGEELGSKSKPKSDSIAILQNDGTTSSWNLAESQVIGSNLQERPDSTLKHQNDGGAGLDSIASLRSLQNDKTASSWNPTGGRVIGSQHSSGDIMPVGEKKSGGSLTHPSPLLITREGDNSPTLDEEGDRGRLAMTDESKPTPQAGTLGGEISNQSTVEPTAVREAKQTGQILQKALETVDARSQQQVIADSIAQSAVAVGLPSNSAGRQNDIAVPSSQAQRATGTSSWSEAIGSQDATESRKIRDLTYSGYEIPDLERSQSATSTTHATDQDILEPGTYEAVAERRVRSGVRQTTSSVGDVVEDPPEARLYSIVDDQGLYSPTAHSTSSAALALHAPTSQSPILDTSIPISAIRHTKEALRSALQAS